MKNLKSILTVFLLALGTFGLNAQQVPFEVKVVGSGEPILFFPGFTCTDEVWEDQVEELSKNYECHLFTFAGFGDVPAIEFPWYPKIEEALSNYINEYELESSVVIGHSLGGTMALSLASAEPIFKKIVIVDALTSTGAMMFPNYASENMVYDSPYNNQVLAMNENQFQQMAAGMAAGMTSNPERQKQIAAWMVQADRETYVYGYTDYLKVDLRDAVSQIETPVVILAATKPFGEAMAKQTYNTQYANLDTYDLRMAPDAAHFIMFDQPEWFMNQLLETLKD
ncbi:alpha/beta fold hydrolase [Croceivirga thetidis]|uniref:Alpha/beta hydrolase n=1 Tax=Croceivirga thetidis TaxID=2721623 RepID=A0ABX1GMM3_9FLAO|nr:alpha/beta hydrolase [Croceivirga thetidis]NKI31163.1 alpha/beta hydrolase [Croceivirga thetidis]